LLYGFTGGADGGNLVSGVVLDSAGNVYGTTVEGGTFNQGVVYEIVKITATLKPATLTFGPQPLNTTSPPQRISLSNHTAFPINVTGVTTQGDFAISTNKCQNGVKPGTHCDVFVTYTPTGRGTKPRTGTLTFVDNAFNGPQTAGLAGTVPAITSTAVTTSGSPSSVGQPVTFTAMVTNPRTHPRRRFGDLLGWNHISGLSAHRLWNGRIHHRLPLGSKSHYQGQLCRGSGL
jgi:hypothetical protein